VVRTLKAIGLWAKTKPKNPSENDAIEINRIVHSLTRKVMGNASPRSLREIDKTLMEISKNGLIR